MFFSPGTPNPQDVRAAAASATPLPGGYKFIPITPELISLLTRAGSTLSKLLPIAEKFYPRLLAARSNFKNKFVLTQMLLTVAATVRESMDDSAINAFLLTHDIQRSEELLAKGRELLLAAAWYEFKQLPPEDFKEIARQAGEYFGQWVISDIAKRGVR